MATATQSLPARRTLALSGGAQRTVIRIATGIVLLLLWEGLVTWLTPSYVARPSGVIKALPAVLRDEPSIFGAFSAGFWASVGHTVKLVFAGLAAGVVAGVFVGLAMGRLRDAESALKLYVNAFFALPTIAILPLMTLWFGYRDRAELALIMFGAFMPVCLNVYDGVRRLPTEYIEVSKTYHARWWNVWFGIALPASLPYLLAGLRLAFGRALVGAVVAEYLLALNGLGNYIKVQTSSFHQNQAMVAVLVLMLIAVSMNAAIDFATRRFLPWFRRSE